MAFSGRGAIPQHHPRAAPRAQGEARVRRGDQQEETDQLARVETGSHGLAALPPGNRLHVQRRAQLRLEVHHAPDHQEHGLHLLQGTAPDRTALHHGCNLGVVLRAARRPLRVAHAIHRGRPDSADHRIHDSLREGRTHRRQCATVLFRSVRRLRRRLPHPTRLQRLDDQQSRWPSEESTRYRVDDSNGTYSTLTPSLTQRKIPLFPPLSIHPPSITTHN